MMSHDNAETFELAELMASLKTAGQIGPASDDVARLAVKDIEELPALFQPRGMSEKHISDLVKAIHNFGEVEPLTLIKVGERNIVIDGHHRLEAYRLAKGTFEVPVQYFHGSIEDAVLEAGKANSKVKLPMTTTERMDYGWRLVLLGTYSKSQICGAAAISDGQVAEMRRVKAHLGDEAFSAASWWRARSAARGSNIDMSDEQREQWKEQRAEEYAGRLAEAFSTRLAKDPEIAAMALARYFGRKLPAVWHELREHLSESEREDDADYSDF